MPETRGAPASGHINQHDPYLDPATRTFADRVFAVVARIPCGRVTTYGAIARALGAPRAAREVGWALNVAPADAGLPCHRVVDRQGVLSGGWHWGHPDVMASLLHDEGVPFLEPHRVDLAACLWDPAAENQTSDSRRETRDPQQLTFPSSPD